uniref:GCN5-related N-acetyltransferase n=1 Tax=Cyanothece sp. (strain PCC 7425 / ATCC 29141) TaxID=395961 RepID=B8HUW2_CYAP4
MMQLHRIDQIDKFWHLAQAYLLQAQAEHNLLLGISHTLLNDPDRYPDPCYLAIVESDGEILATAIRTPPYKVVLSKAENLQAVTLIAQDLPVYQAEYPHLPLPGVSGLVAEVEAFLVAWQMLTGQAYRPVLKMRIHQLTQVELTATTSGGLRPARMSDRPLLLEWFAAFAAEVGEVVSETAEQMVDHSLKNHSVYVWENDIPVCFACGSRSLPAAARIGPVYTPPEHRRQGYASACVAQLSQQFLQQGCQHCFLFTDQDNPTSNHIYRTIGYRPVCDWHDYSFTLKY